RPLGAWRTRLSLVIDLTLRCFAGIACRGFGRVRSRHDNPSSHDKSLLTARVKRQLTRRCYEAFPRTRELGPEERAGGSSERQPCRSLRHPPGVPRIALAPRICSPPLAHQRESR